MGDAMAFGARVVWRTSSRRAPPWPGDGVIYVLWHRDLPLFLLHLGARALWMMVSGAPRMRPIARFCHHAGVHLVRGATGERGRAALAEIEERLRAGEPVSLAVDGPAGPAFRVKPGCVEFARRTGAPIVAVSNRARRDLPLLFRWDRMRLHAPFESFEIVYSEPIFVAEDENERTALARVEAALRSLDAQPSRESP